MKTIAVGDLHFPFAHGPTVAWMIRVIERERPDVVVQIGDLFDLFSFSRFPRRIIITPAEELKRARLVAERFWAGVSRAAPKAKKKLVLGNHDSRILDRVKDRLPEIMPLVEPAVEKLFAFDGVESCKTERDDLVVDGVVYEHGYLKAGAHMRNNMAPTVHGHDHRTYILTESIRGRTLWEMSVGHGADPDSEALSYPKKRHSNWQRGIGIIEDGNPRFLLAPV